MTNSMNKYTSLSLQERKPSHNLTVPARSFPLTSCTFPPPDAKNFQKIQSPTFGSEHTETHRKHKTRHTSDISVRTQKKSPSSNIRTGAFTTRRETKKQSTSKKHKQIQYDNAYKKEAQASITFKTYRTIQRKTYIQDWPSEHSSQKHNKKQNDTKKMIQHIAFKRNDGC